MILPVTYINELKRSPESLTSKFTVIKTDYDMIIGRQTIKKFDLTSSMFSQFSLRMPANKRPNSKNPKDTVFLNTLMIKDAVVIDSPSKIASLDLDLAPLNPPRQILWDRAERIATLSKESMFNFIDKEK